MRKLVLSLIFFLASIVLFAQQRITYGINVGSGVSYLVGTNSGLTANTDPREAITAGVSADVRVWKSWYVQAELNYQNIGGGKDGNIVVPIPLAGYNKYVFQYLSVPVVIKFKIPHSGVGFYAGLQDAYLLSGKVTTGATVPLTVSGAQLQPNTTYSGEYLNSTDFSGIAGVEYYFHVKGLGRVGFSGRYQWSLKTMDNDDNNAATSLKNKVFLLTLGYRF